MSVLLCENISLKKSKSQVVNFNFNFLNNKIYGIIGKSDSGKDLLFDLLSSKLNPKSGDIWVDGENLKFNDEMQSRICYIPCKTRFTDLITVNGLFKKMQRQYAKWDNFLAYQLCTNFNIPLNNFINVLPKDKFELVIAIISLASRANIVLYDNPLNNVDLKNRDEFFNFLYNYHLRYPNTVIITSNYIDEISYLFDRILFMDNGRLFNFFNINDLKENFRYLSGKTEVLKSLIGGIKIIGAEEKNGILTVCIRKKLTKDDNRKFQKYMIEISDVPIQKIFIYLINLREKRNKKNDMI